MDDGAPIPREIYQTRTTQGADGLPRRFISTADYLAMEASGVLGGQEKLELLGGELVPMNAELNKHAVWKLRLNRLWMPIIATTDFDLAVEPTLFLEDGSAPEPDILIRPMNILPEDVRGPDCRVIVEIADSTIAKDLGIKKTLYARNGVNEYWVLDAENRVAHLFTEPREDGSWALTRQCSDSETLTPSFMAALALKLTDLDF